MAKQQISVNVTPQYTHQGDTDVTVFALEEKDGRLTVGVYTGVAHFHLRPTAAEARELIAALQRALEPAAQLAEDA